MRWIVACGMLWGCAQVMEARDEGEANAVDLPLVPEGDGTDDEELPPDASCDVIPAEPEPYTLTVHGDGFSDDEGAAVYVQTDMVLSTVDGSCRAVTQTTIEDGSFSITVTNLTDRAVYPCGSAFIDRNGDGVCNPNTDPSWYQCSAMDAELQIERTDFTAPGDDPEGCRSFSL